MIRRAIFRCATAAAALVTFVKPAGAQEPVTLKSSVIFYGDNAEFNNPFREGETLLGTAIRLYAEIGVSSRVLVRLGAFGNHRFGEEKEFRELKPLAGLIVVGRRSRFIIGSLETTDVRGLRGPDREGPHALLPPLQRETLSFDRPHEAGLQWRFSGRRLRHDSWLNWQRLNTPAHRERFDAGVVGQLGLAGPVSLGFQAHVVHRGGQLFASGAVADSYAYGPGLISERRGGPLANLSMEVYGLLSHYTPDRAERRMTRNGAGLFVRFAIEKSGWRAHAIVWRACDFIKEEGDPNYLSVRLDGTRYRATRDYSEAGLSRAFQLGPGAAIEASARAHRVERHYDYSYRVLAKVDLGWRIH